MFHVCFYLRHLDDENMVCILPTQTVPWQPYILGRRSSSVVLVSRRQSSSFVVVGRQKVLLGSESLSILGSASEPRPSLESLGNRFHLGNRFGIVFHLRIRSSVSLCRLESAAPVRSDSRVSPPVGVAWRYTKLPHR